MSWIITGTEKILPDPYWTSTSLLLHGDGANGSTTIIDSSPSPKTVATFGNAQISTAQSKFGGSSIAFDGNGDYINSPSNPDFAFGTGDFTIELFARFNQIKDQCLYDTLAFGAPGSRFTGFAWVMQSSGRLNLFHSNQFRLQSTAVFTTNTWYHLVLCRSGSTFGYFIDGQSDATTSLSPNFTDSRFTCGVVADTAASYFLDGNVDEYRITKGVARYTSNFTPPTAPFPDF